jgi:hypothetical protein
MSRKLPIPALFGLRLVARRPRRAVRGVLDSIDETVEP